MGLLVLHCLERYAEEDWIDHHANAEKEVLGVLDGRFEDVCVREGPDIWRTLGPCHYIGENEA